MRETVSVHVAEQILQARGKQTFPTAISSQRNAEMRYREEVGAGTWTS